MPGYDQSGPMGQGSMTGRRMGKCKINGTIPKNQTNDESENSNKTIIDNISGRGLGWGRGMGGRGRGRGMGQQNRFRSGR